MPNFPQSKRGKAAKYADLAGSFDADPFDVEPAARRPARDRALSLSEILVLQMPPDIELLGRLILAGSLGLLYGLRGCGKSLLAMIMGYAIAGGKAVAPWGTGSGDVVCYLDGEMRIHGFQERLDQLHALNTQEASQAAVRENFWVVSRHLIGDLVGTLDTQEGQRSIENYFPTGMRLLIIDNLSAWTAGGGEDIHGWQNVKSWLLQLRVRGIAVLLIHHAGKGGAQRGTSAHEDLVDYSIEVSPVPIEDEPEVTAFKVTHKKLRDQLPHLKNPQGFRIRSQDGVMRFTVEPVVLEAQKLFAKIVELHTQNWSGKDIAQEVGTSEASVSRVLRKYREAPRGEEK